MKIKKIIIVLMAAAAIAMAAAAGALADEVKCVIETSYVLKDCAEQVYEQIINKALSMNPDWELLYFNINTLADYIYLKEVKIIVWLVRKNEPANPPGTGKPEKW